MLKHWQAEWDVADTGRFAHSIIPKVTTRAWFEGHREERGFVCTISRVMSGLDTLLRNLTSIDSKLQITLYAPVLKIIKPWII
jgi:hypothetical protein